MLCKLLRCVIGRSQRIGHRYRTTRYYRTDTCVGRVIGPGGRWWPSSAYKDAHCGLVRQRVIKYEIFAQ